MVAFGMLPDDLRNPVNYFIGIVGINSSSGLRTLFLPR